MRAKRGRDRIATVARIAATCGLLVSATTAAALGYQNGRHAARVAATAKESTASKTGAVQWLSVVEPVLVDASTAVHSFAATFTEGGTGGLDGHEFALKLTRQGETARRRIQEACEALAGAPPTLATALEPTRAECRPLDSALGDFTDALEPGALSKTLFRGGVASVNQAAAAWDRGLADCYQVAEVQRPDSIVLDIALTLDARESSPTRKPAPSATPHMTSTPRPVAVAGKRPREVIADAVLHRGCSAKEPLRRQTILGVIVAPIRTGPYDAQVCLTLPNHTRWSVHGVGIRNDDRVLTDRLGHGFIDLTPGQIEGVVVILFNGNSTRVLGPVPFATTVTSSSPFRLSIRDRDCNPNCAEGHATFHTLQWSAAYRTYVRW